MLGLGASGEAATRLLLSEGAKVTAVDRADNAALRERAGRLAALGACVRVGQVAPPEDAADMCVVSPGLSVDSPWLAAVRQRGTPLVAELELGWSRLNCRVLAVTGSNGKSTLVRLCADALIHAGVKAAVAGNYEERISGSAGEDGLPGVRPIPVSQVALNGGTLDWLVLEVSSFQLETVRNFRPNVGVLLNVLPNHLDRHGDMENYERVKLRMFSRMEKDDVGIVPDEWLARKGRSRIDCGAGRILTFGASPSALFRYRDGAITREGKPFVSLAGTLFDNPVLGLAGAAAAAAVTSCGLSCNSLEAAARSFTPLAHRLQDVGERNGVRFIDDSKSTNIAALGAALKSMCGGVRLIAGGRPKGDDVAAVRDLLAEKAESVYLIGEAAELMLAKWRDVVPCVLCRTLDRAVQMACADAREGETVLLSPGCLSWDQFADFGERGDMFIRLVLHAIKTLDNNVNISNK